MWKLPRQSCCVLSTDKQARLHGAAQAPLWPEGAEALLVPPRICTHTHARADTHAHTHPFSNVLASADKPLALGLKQLMSLIRESLIGHSACEDLI